MFAWKCQWRQLRSKQLLECKHVGMVETTSWSSNWNWRGKGHSYLALDMSKLLVTADLKGFAHQNHLVSQERKRGNKRKTPSDLLLSSCLVDACRMSEEGSFIKTEVCRRQTLIGNTFKHQADQLKQKKRAHGMARPNYKIGQLVENMVPFCLVPTVWSGGDGLKM